VPACVGAPAGVDACGRGCLRGAPGGRGPTAAHAVSDTTGGPVAWAPRRVADDGSAVGRCGDLRDRPRRTLPRARNQPSMARSRALRLKLTAVSISRRAIRGGSRCAIRGRCRCCGAIGPRIAGAAAAAVAPSGLRLAPLITPWSIRPSGGHDGRRRAPPVARRRSIVLPDEQVDRWAGVLGGRVRTGRCTGPALGSRPAVRRSYRSPHDQRPRRHPTCYL
jgi:hypothetical protein